MKRREAGQGLVEYALILVLVAIVVIIIPSILGPSIGDSFDDLVCTIVTTTTFSWGSVCPDLVRIRVNETITINVIENDTNLYPNSVQITSGPYYGNAENLGGGFVKYKPDRDFVGVDSFNYEACIYRTDVCGHTNVTIEVGGSGRRSAGAGAASIDGGQKMNADSGSEASPTEWLLDFLEQAARQQESLYEGVEYLEEAVVEALEILVEYAEENGYQDLQEAFASLLQEAQDGNYEVFLSDIPDIGTELGGLPAELQVAVILEVEPRIIATYHAISSASVPYETYETTLQLWIEAEAANPSGTGDMIPRLQEIWEDVDQRNLLVEEAPSALAYAACRGIAKLYATGIQEYIKIAQGYQAQIPPCEN